MPESFNKQLQHRGGLILVRHGESEKNVGGIYNARPDHPTYVQKNLTRLGRQQAVEAGQQLLRDGIPMIIEVA